MIPKHFPEENRILGAEQPEYQPLPAFVDKTGVVATCWELSDEDLKLITEKREIWLLVYTFGKPLQPVAVLAKKPITTDLINPEQL